MIHGAPFVTAGGTPEMPTLPVDSLVSKEPKQPMMGLILGWVQDPCGITVWSVKGLKKDWSIVLKVDLG